MVRIDVCNTSRGIDSPLLTLWDNESVCLFFSLLCRNGDIYQTCFGENRVALLSYNGQHSPQTGIGIYELGNGEVTALLERGTARGLLQRVRAKHLLP